MSLEPNPSSGPAAPAPARVLDRNVFRGPHLYSNTPMVAFTLDLGELEHWPTNRLAGFLKALVELLPGLERHTCSYHESCGFVRRLREGTWLGHVAEHIAIEIQALSGAQTVTRGKTRSVKGRPGVYRVMYAYEDEEVALLAGRLALEIVDSLLPQALRGILGLDVLADR